MKFILGIFLLLNMAGMSAAETAPSAAEPTKLVDIGRRIYQDGILENGETLQGMSAAQVTVKGKQAACTVCHRKSGLGSSEGANIIRPIVGRYIFPAQKSKADTQVTSELHKRALYAPASTRAEYTPGAFAKVLRLGVDYNGQSLDQLMPRYNLNDKDIAALTAYLNTLSSRADPGVDQESIHFATVVMPGAKPSESKAMLDVLDAFFADKNGGSRSEARRRAVGTEVGYRSYRRWMLHVWNLTGPAESWNTQLEQYYSKQPVFAVISGIGGDNWRALHDFCERQEVPCMFPSSNLPVTDNAYYSFYFSRGMVLEAEVLAKYLAKQIGKQSSILQVFNQQDSAGAMAAKVLRDKLQNLGGKTEVSDWILPANMDAAIWQKLLQDKQPQTLVMWLNKEDLLKFSQWDSTGYAPQQIIFSGSMLGSTIASDSSLLGKSLQKYSNKIRLVYPFELPRQTAQYLQRTKLWLRAKKLAVTEEQIQANTYFAAMVVGDSISHILDQYYRDYFIERLEHMVARSLVTSVYPHMSLGPGQRYASKGAYVIKYSQQSGRLVEPLTEWVVP